MNNYKLTILFLCHQVNQLMDGRFSETVEQVTIVDCRYPYEFDGGHIKVIIKLIINITFIISQ